MTNHNILLLIPVENQVCELDAKILLACITARRRLQAIIGLKRDVESRITLFLGRAACGMSRECAEGLRDHKQAVFEDFQRIIPELDKAFPEKTIVIRPHPTENHEVYHRIVYRCRRVHVNNEGNVVPWLMATKAFIHNGCTTGVEAYATGTPAINYRASINETYDNGFYRLPNRMSYQCFNFDDLRDMLRRILRGEIGLQTVMNDSALSISICR